MNITINNEKITLEGQPYLSQDSDSEYPYYEQNLSNGELGQFYIALTQEQFDALEDESTACDWTHIWVNGEEYRVN